MLPANTPCYVIDYPSGRFGFVGMIPAVLGDVVAATRDDIMAGRAFTRPSDGATVTLKFPSFESQDAAIAFAADRGVTVKLPSKG